ncbi:MAG TPA: imidazolonepropionase [Rectinemataceae bacterium]
MRPTRQRSDPTETAAGSIAIVDIGELATPIGKGALRGAEMGRLRRVRGAALVAQAGRIIYAGPQDTAECKAALDAAKALGAPILDADGAACVPGFVDSHTHFLFAGYRADEFFWRAKGLSYMEIHHRGGGIRRTMEATRLASASELLALGRARLDSMLAMGVTTVEGKSGYGLNRDTEIRQLEVMRELDSLSPVDIVSTFMGPHSTPPEFEGRPSAYIDYLIGEVLPEVARLRLARYADIFCEKGVFGIDDSRRYLEAARSLGFGLKIHADEIEPLGGAGLAAEFGAASAEHLLKASKADLAAMAEAGVLAVCLPLTAFNLREPYADARSMIDLGLAVALASDLNPGSCPSQSIPLIFALGVLYMGLSFDECLSALTLNGAAALGLAGDRGSLESGKRADLIILDAPEASHLAYRSGMDLVRTVVKDGIVAFSSAS